MQCATFHNGSCRALGPIEKYSNKIIWLFECLVKGPGCKGTFETSISSVRNGGTRSCGCSRRKDITNKIYYDPDKKPTCQALWYIDNKDKLAKWLFRCLYNGYKCKETFITFMSSVESEEVRSCGCYRSPYKHGLSNSRVYDRWNKMYERCYNPNNPAYENYGKRGIRVCWRWHKDNPDGFINFYNDIGYRIQSANDTLERLDNDLDYSPDNCDIAPPKTQGRNRRSNKIQNKEEADFIRDLHKLGYSNRQMSLGIGCSRYTIDDIINNKTWI